MRVCEKQYKYIDTGRFSDDSASWIICSHDAPNKPHKCIVFSFTGDKSKLTDVHMYKYDYPNVSLTSDKIF